MERFTNDNTRFINQIKSELLEFRLEENCEPIFTYAELPHFLTYAYSYNWTFNRRNSKYRLIRKEWNSKYDHAKFDKGIYNLDRISILEKEIPIRLEDEKYLNLIDWKKINKTKFKGIILDGLSCELQIKKIKKSFNWNVDEEMNIELKELIYFIRNWKREMDELCS